MFYKLVFICIICFFSFSVSCDQSLIGLNNLCQGLCAATHLPVAGALNTFYHSYTFKRIVKKHFFPAYLTFALFTIVRPV